MAVALQSRVADFRLLFSFYAPISAKPKGGGGVGQLTGIWLWHISPGWGFWSDIMHLIFQFYVVEEK